jgi:hypothetical protein
VENCSERLEAGGRRCGDSVVATVNLSAANNAIAYLVADDFPAHIPLAVIYRLEVKDSFAGRYGRTMNEFVYPLVAQRVQLLVCPSNPSISVGCSHSFGVVAWIIGIFDVDRIVAQVGIQLCEHRRLLTVVIFGSGRDCIGPITQYAPFTVILECVSLG